ncbi:hypothetical protein [Altererythrobacter sp. Root672]|uniref:hypothetical protein n=1 Tax=Altererythrobacter sp. Root672 TaxID=1736584 RepID=UPI0006F3E1F6|nr:hypothetical protein [Altererythrobacter sp. Root672]KRA80388.1 hypothetical protein ASD76_14525 [Altererythrobacter sp. Root672]
MTKKSLDNSAARVGSGSITRHPAFPAIVALWFTALLGLGGLLLPVALLERVVEMSRIGSLVTAAAPPLGVSARLIVAVGLGAIGAVLGFKIARRVTGAGSRDETALRAPDAPRRPFNVAADSGAEETSGESEPTNHPLRRRRALTIADLGPAVERIPPDAEPQYAHAPAYGEAAEYDAEPPVTEVEPEPGFHEWRRAEDDFESPVAAEIPFVEDAHEAIEAVPAVETVEEFEAVESSDAPEWPEAEPAIEAASAPEPAPPASPSTPLDDLDITQLVARFADTVKRRREWLASTQQPAPPPLQPYAVEVEPAAPAQAPIAPLPAEEEPAAKRPPFFDWLHHLNVDALDDAPMPGFSIPMHTAAFVNPSLQPGTDEAEAEVDEEVEAEIESDDAFGSLIEMKNPFALPRSDFIRIEASEAEAEDEIEPADEPEEAQERLDTTDAEVSLRAALAKLQQLSGNP